MKYYIITYGCQMNKSDSERLASRLEKDGHQPAQNLAEADLIALNACSVRQSAIDRIYAKIRKIKNTKYQIPARQSLRPPARTSSRRSRAGLRPMAGGQNTRYKIILTGCLLEKDRKKLEDQVDQIWPFCDFSVKPKYQSPSRTYVPIMTGCNNFCSYCAVPYTRGREYSRPAEEIIKEIKESVKNGCQEITLLGQNVNSYQGQSSEERTVLDFSALLRLLDNLSGDFQLKFLTSHPKDMSDELIEAIRQGEKIIKEIHLPIQSGDNEILKKMNRGYTAEHYKNLIKKIRRQIPGVKISTDIIVGFPTETKKQFQNTVKLFKRAKFDSGYIARYSPRPGTAAAKLKDDVPAAEKKKRWKILTEILRSSRK